MSGSEAAVAAEVASLRSSILTPEQSQALKSMLADDVWLRLSGANHRDAAAWGAVQTKSDWEAFGQERIAALRRSLGSLPPAGIEPESLVTGGVQGDGFRIENVVYASGPGLPVTANLYLPDPLRQAMPGIVICHSHHFPKTQPELQDMGMTWARSGTAVLVPEMLGHGERRQQPFGKREDYHSRYRMAIQLYLAGECLMGVYVADLMRGVDLLLARPDIDPDRIILMGSVAGGGDPAAVAAALDDRIACSAPFNFGCASTRKPMSADDTPVCNWACGSDWESTRSLRLSARDGFLPWAIVAATAPRRLIFAKEFGFEAASDPAYRRVAKVYGLVGAPDRVAPATGWGVHGELGATGCNNIGPPHRAQVYPLLEQWLGMPIPEEYQRRRDDHELLCMTPEAHGRFQPRMLHEAAAGIATEKLSAAHLALAALPAEQRAEALRQQWAGLLGEVEPVGLPALRRSQSLPSATMTAEKLLLAVDPGILLPAMLLAPAGEAPKPAPVVVCMAQQGKAAFLVRRAGEIASLLDRGVAVCVFDPRGVGESRPGDDRSRTSQAMELSSVDLKLGDTTLGLRLRDLRSVLQYLGCRADLDTSRVGLWGDSFAPVNPERFVDPPLRTDHPPHQAEPLGQLLALLGGLFEPEVRAVVARGGLVGFASVLDCPACYVPLDVIVPGALAVGDVADLVAALAPRPVRVDGLVDGRNRAASDAGIETTFTPAREAYEREGGPLLLSHQVSDDTADWLADALVP